MKGLILTYLLAYGGAAASLVRPFHGLLDYFAFAVIKPEALWYWSVPAGNYSRIVAIALLTGWAINGFGNWQFGKVRVIVFSFAGFLSWSAISGIFSEDQAVVIRKWSALGAARTSRTFAESGAKSLPWLAVPPGPVAGGGTDSGLYRPGG